MSENSGIRVNFSQQEAESEARDFEALPTGKYNCAITDVSLEECGPNSKNPGKNYWALELTVQNGPYESRKMWANVMLFDGALYSLSQLLKATGREDALKTGDIPPAEFFEGKAVVVTAKKQLDTYRMNKAKEAGEANPTPEYKTEVKGFKAPGSDTATEHVAASGSGNSLLP